MAIGRNKDRHLTSARRIRHLRELIAALDRRTRHVERAGEGAISRDAAFLRKRAVKRIDALERQRFHQVAVRRVARIHQRRFVRVSFLIDFVPTKLDPKTIAALPSATYETRATL